MGCYGLVSSGSGQGPVVGSCEHGNEPSDSIQCCEILEKPGDCRLLKKDPAPWS
jgi:hypothetical protein